jgi:hypothetical protein
MKKIPLIAVLTVLGFLGSVSFRANAVEEDGVALAVVYDTSGSMNELVRDSSGKQSPKHVIAKRALQAVVKRLQGFVESAPAGAPRKMQAGLYVFSGSGAKELVKFGPLDVKDMDSWTRHLPLPSSGTPLGNALETASEAVLKSPLSRKHVLVITDGMNTVGPDPAKVLPELKRQAEEKHSNLSVHFVAFDVDARVFNSLKKQGVTVVGAANETQLNTQLGFILEKKILLEDEEPPIKN